MAKSSEYFGLPYVVSLILCIFPPTAWILGIIQRFAQGKIVAAILRIPFGLIAWIGDIICMVTKKQLWHLINA